MARLQVTIKADEPLRFRKKTQLSSGEIVWVSLRYEKLYRWCKICHRICHEEDLCPLNPKTQDKLANLVSGMTRSLGNQPLVVEPEQVKPTSGTLPSGKGRSHPSWWRPESPEKTTEEDYRKSKAEGKRPVGNFSSSVWERLEKRHSGKWDSSSKDRYPDSRKHRRLSPEPARYRDRREAPSHYSKDTHHRSYKSQAPYPNRLIDNVQEPRRKRSFEDSFKTKGRKPPPRKENLSGPGLNAKKLHHDQPRPPLPPIVSDSQATLSDPLVNSSRAKQVVVSPEHTRVRPFRLNHLTCPSVSSLSPKVGMNRPWKKRKKKSRRRPLQTESTKQIKSELAEFAIWRIPKKL